MNKQILEEKVYYYEDGVKYFDKLMQTIDELDMLEAISGDSSWTNWTSSNDKSFIYGSTKSFDIEKIKQMEEPFKTKMAFISILTILLVSCCVAFLVCPAEPEKLRTIYLGKGVEIA